MARPKKPIELSRLEYKTDELEKLVEAAEAYHEKAEADKKFMEQKQEEWGVLEGQEASLETAEDRAAHLEKIARIKAQLLREKDELREFLAVVFPKEMLARDWARREAEALESRHRALENRLHRVELQWAAQTQKEKRQGQQNTKDEQQRRWNERIIALEMAKTERETSSSQKVARLNELKTAEARNQDLSQPPPTITPSPTP